MNDQEREHARLAKLSTYRINATWGLFERFVIDGKNPTEALRLASEAMDVWSPWFEENHIEAPEPPDMPTQVEQSAAKVTEAIKKAMEELETIRNRRWWRRCFSPAVEHEAEQPSTALPSAENLAEQHDPK